jgi:protein tyrosine/serine phosphatase
MMQRSPAQIPKAKWILKCRLFLAAFTLLLVVSTGSFLYLKDNFHAITPGEAYRSAQLDGEKLEFYVKKYQIRSILNLRGRRPDHDWYKEEIRTSANLNVVHYDISLSAVRKPSPEDVRELIHIFRTAPRPLLIHCKAGADRSGLAAAMWKVIVDREPKSEARKQLSIKFAHIPLGGPEAMDSFFDNWDPTKN